MITALLNQGTTTTTTGSTATTAPGFLPGLPGGSTTSATTAPTTSSTIVGSTSTTGPATYGPATTGPTTAGAKAAVRAATTPTTRGPVSSAVSGDHGVIHQVFVDGGASTSAAHTAQIYLDGPLKVVVILIVAWLLTRLVNRVSHRAVNGLRLVSPVVKATPRGAARVRTLAGAFTQILRALIWLIALLEVLNEFSIDLTPFVATATVVGAAVGFGAQTLVKDFLSGILLLAEDQYGVGDHIAIGTGSTQTSGTVESVNLRVTRLRGSDGGILYVPNGDIRTLSNDTETDSQALVDVLVPYGTDLEAAGRAVQEAAEEMAAEEAWAPEFAGEPFFAGVSDATEANGVVLRVMALTRPGQHLRLAREMRLRIMQRLRDEGVAWGPARQRASAPSLDPAPPAGEGEPTPRTPPAVRAAAKAATKSVAPARKSAAAKAAGVRGAGAKAAAAKKGVKKTLARKLTRKRGEEGS